MTLSITLVIFQMFCFFNKVETTRNLRWSTKLGDELETCLVPSNSMDPKCREPLKSSRRWALPAERRTQIYFVWTFGGMVVHDTARVQYIYMTGEVVSHMHRTLLYISHIGSPPGHPLLPETRKKMAIHQTTAGHRMKIRTYEIIVGATNSVHQRHTKCWWGISKYMTFTNGYGRACVSRSPRYFSGYSSVIDWVPGTF